MSLLAKSAAIGAFVLVMIGVARISGNLPIGDDLRPPAVQNIAEQTEEATTPPPADEDRNAVEEGGTVAGDTSEDAAASPAADAAGVETEVNQEVTEDSVKIDIKNNVNTNEPISNRVKVEIKPGQDPNVEINTFNCSDDTYDCSDFTTCEEAQSVFNQCSNDVHNLDPNGTGPCSALCK